MFAIPFAGERKEGALSSQAELIGDTLAYMNVVRQAFGKEPMAELPDARPGDAGDCLFHRALGDLGVVSVNGEGMTFTDTRVASTVGALWATPYEGNTVRVPRQVSEVIALFDGDEFPHYNVP